MEKDIILLVIGIIIVLVSLIILVLSKRKKSYNKIENYYNNKNHIEQINRASKLENDMMLERIQSLENEVLKLKQENDKIKKENIEENSFKPMLNYSLFKSKNKTIIDLYKSGKSPEQIAKILNKSIREIEMVIKLIK